MGPKHELRISFPEGDHHPSYNIAVQRLLDERSSESSIRTDNYYVTEAHFGLKQRNGEALELKVREKKQKVDWSFGQSHLCPTVWSTCVVRKYM